MWTEGRMRGKSIDGLEVRRKARSGRFIIIIMVGSVIAQ